MDVTSLFSKVNEFFSTFGSPIIIGTILFVICLAFKVKAKKRLHVRHVREHWLDGLYVADQ